jgi:HK97 gp10 family phage protein
VADDTRHVKGLAELQRFLDTLPAKLEQRIMRGALRKGMRLIHVQAKSDVAVEDGVLRDSMKVATSVRGGTVRAILRSKDFKARFVEYGTSAHVIAGKNGGWLNFGGVFARSVNHPGASKKPFMRPARDGRAQDALVAAGNEVKNRLTKEGLEVSHIMVEGDE